MKHYLIFVLLLVFATPAWAQVVVPGSLNPANRANSAVASFRSVTNDDLLNSSDQPENWLMYSGNYSSQRYTELDPNAVGLSVTCS